MRNITVTRELATDRFDGGRHERCGRHVAQIVVRAGGAEIAPDSLCW
jgi:hypothetical protein